MRGPLKQNSATGRVFQADIFRHAAVTRASILAGRVLFLFMVVLLAVMPLTERLWTFDGFLRGDQDLEFGLLTMAIILCMTLVLSQRINQGVLFLQVLWQWLSRLFLPPDRATHSTCRTSLARRSSEPIPGSALHLYNLPLRL